MRISTRARYALRLMVDLVRRYDGSHPVHLRQIAEENDLSHGYLEQLMISLRNASLVRGLSGRKGGYVLARPPEEIKLTEIIEAAIGPINVVDCVLCPENCDWSPDCKTRPIWVMINARIKEVLNRYSLADMAADNWLVRITEELAPSAGELAYPKKVIRRKQKAIPGRPRSKAASASRGGGTHSTPGRKESTIGKGYRRGRTGRKSKS